MKLLRMKPEYVEWTKAGRKHATTRTKNKGLGQFELVTGSRYKPVKTGTVIEIREIIGWTPAAVSSDLAFQRHLLNAEGLYTTSNETDAELAWGLFLALLGKLNGRKVKPTDKLYTHFFQCRECKRVICLLDQNDLDGEGYL
jgi:hypothetical protein